MTRRESEGFTLIEVLVVVVMVGIIAVALAAVFGVVVRSTPSTTARADDARSLVGLTTWLPNDVSATPMMPYDGPGGDWENNWIDAPDAAIGCDWDDSASINVVTLEWYEEFRGSLTTYRSSYRLIDEVEQSYLARVYCILGEVPTVSKLTAELPPVDKLTWTLDWKTQDRGGVEFLVGLAFEMDGIGTDQPGTTLRVDATSKNFNEALDDPIPPPDYTPLTPPTTTTAPNAKPDAGDVAAAFQIGVPITLTLDVADDYDDPATLTPSLTFPSEIPLWTIDVDVDDQRVVTILPDVLPIADVTYEIQYTVTDSGGPDTPAVPRTSDPATIFLTLTVDPPAEPEAPEADEVSVVAQRDQEVSFLVDATDPDGDDSALDVELFIPADASFLGWSYTIDPSNNVRVIIDGEPFLEGTYELTYRVTDETGLWAESTVTITLTPIPCSASFSSTNPTSAARANGGNGGVQLKVPVPIMISRSGDCSLGLEYRPIDQTFTQSFGSSSTATALPATTLELWPKKGTTILSLVRTDGDDPGDFTTSDSEWSLYTP